MNAPKRPSRPIRRRRRETRKRLRIERLEMRRLLATLQVTSTIDAVDFDPGDGVCEISQGGPCSLRAAIQEANSLPNSDGPDRIEIPAGTYSLTLAGIDEQLSAGGDLDINEDLVLQGAGAADTIIDAGGIDRVIDVVRGTVTINAVTIRGGLIQDADSSVDGSGGGIRNEGDLTINDSIVTGNSATFGAGVGNYNGTLKILRSTISGNGGDGTQRGGGIANESNYDPATLEVTDSTIADNRADSGGGIQNRTYDGVATATITRSTVSGNTANDGAGISNRSVVYYGGEVAATLTIRGSTISGNIADASGGGIRNEADAGSNALLDAANSTIAANSANSGDGGGIVNVPSPSADVTIQSVILAGNAAGGDGPDLSSQSTTASFSLIQSGLGHSIVNGNANNIVGQDPLLETLADNGGPTLTHALADGSPAIDRGTNAKNLTSDQRGSAFTRTVDDPGIDNAGDGTDIGAVEVGQVAATMDFGDAPDGMPVGGIIRQYPTTLASNGARHPISAAGPTLGSIAPDPEQDGQTSVSAAGDDVAGIDDEDALGPDPIVLTPGQSLSGLGISHDGGATGAVLSAWIDLNLDGDWDDDSEQILTDLVVPAGPSSTSLSNILLPASTPSGTTFIRTRISTQSGLSPRGEAADGEVEDFAATVVEVADVSLTQTVDDANPVLGQNVTFTITVSNQGPNRATNVAATTDLPSDLIFISSAVSQGSFDESTGVWFVGNLNAGDSAVLGITAKVNNSDPIQTTSEIMSLDQADPDSTPGNNNAGEDDQASVTLGTCLTAEPLHVGMNRLTYSCATPGSFSAFVRGTERGLLTFARYSTTVDIADAKEFAIAVADSNGVAVAFLEVSEAEVGQTIRVQAFEMTPESRKSNTLPLQSAQQSLKAAAIGSGGESLREEDLPAAIDAAIAHWIHAGATSVDVAAMRGTKVTIGELPGDAIGRLVNETIILDRDAAGNGWFVDPSPSDESIANDADAVGHIDLVTTLVHEFGHTLGLPDRSDRNHVMHDTLDVGIRRLPVPDTNPTLALDVNHDGIVSALDALIVINTLAREARQAESSIWLGSEFPQTVSLDTNSDFIVSALDALRVINHLDDRQ